MITDMTDAAARPASTPRGDELLAEVRRALAAGEIARADLAGVLQEGRPGGRVGAAEVLLALGGAVVVLGIALIYTTAFLAMDDRAQLTTPYIFPLVFLVLFVLLVRRHRPLWEREVGAFVTLATLGIALAASYAGSGDADPEAWGTVASAVVVVASGLILWFHRPRLRAAGVGLLSGLVVGANFAAAWIGMSGGGFRWLELALAAGCLVAGLALQRSSPDAASLPFAAAVALIVIAGVMGISGDFEGGDITGLSVWHVLLSVTVAAATVGAAVTGQPLLWVAAAGSAMLWLMMTIPVAGTSFGWALVVIAMGLALVGIALVATRFSRHRGHRAASASSDTDHEGN
jgi:hypothetical protein